jgi:tRNA(Arg) A34 adenosine deaminase TadA
MKSANTISFSLPAWVDTYAATCPPGLDLETRMAFVIAASRRNVAEGTGGPFAAAVFASDSGELIALGVNLVARRRLSILHAEIVALTLAQERLGTFDLGGAGVPACELVTSTEPCAMCYGAIPWSGVQRVVTGAFDTDARRIGFDEGPRTRRWREELEERGIKAVSGVLRAEAAAVLDAYAAAGGEIYNPRALSFLSVEH